MNKIILLKNNGIKENEILLRKLSAMEAVTYNITNSDKYVGVEIDCAESLLYRIKYLMLKNLLLNRKFAYLKKNIKFPELNYATCSLLSTLVYFDSAQELKQMCISLADSDIYCVDGIYNFLMQDIIDGWDELVELTNSLLGGEFSEVDIFNVASFMLSSRVRGEKSVFIADPSKPLLTDVSKGGIIDAIPLYDVADFNLLNAIISASPTEVLIEHNSVSQKMLKAIKNLVVVKVINEK